MTQGISMAAVLVLAGAICAFGQTSATPSEGRPVIKVPDPLHLPHSKQIQKFWHTLERCVEEAPDFEITEEKRRRRRLWASHDGSRFFTIYTYTVKIPKFMQSALPGRLGSAEELLAVKLLTEALRDKDVSYYAALLAIHAGARAHTFPLTPLMKKSKTEWAQKRRAFVSGWLSKYSWWEKASAQYRRWFFLRRLSGEHQRELRVTPGALVIHDLSMSSYRRMKAHIKEHGPRKDPSGIFDRMIAIGDAIVDYTAKSDSRRLDKLPYSWSALYDWSALLVNSHAKELPPVLNAFFRYAQVKGDPALLVDMALAALVVRGYEYDAEKGRYTLNDVGKRLLEYAIAHPIPKSVSVARVLKERWDEDAIMKLIQKHHPKLKTWEKFREAYKAAAVVPPENPAAPEK